jgi:hypothetical protein
MLPSHHFGGVLGLRLKIVTALPGVDARRRSESHLEFFLITESSSSRATSCLLDWLQSGY